MVEHARADVALFRALSFTARQLTAAVEHGLRESAGVSLPEFDILSALSASQERRARAGELGHMLAWEKSRISHQVGRMERKGLIERVSCDDDLRGTWVALTDAGADAIAAALPAYEEAVREKLGAAAATDEGADLTRRVLAIGATVSPDSCQGEVESLLAGLDAPGTTEP
jgi:DNA-binding MarR family transcriptional regulator